MLQVVTVAFVLLFQEPELFQESTFALLEQATQLAWPVLFVVLPAGQDVHTVAPAALNVPAAQGAQVPFFSYVPAAHCVHFAQNVLLPVLPLIICVICSLSSLYQPPNV